MEKSEGTLKDFNPEKGQRGKGVIFLVGLIIVCALFYVFAIMPSQKDSAAPVQQGTEQTAPAPTSP